MRPLLVTAIVPARNEEANIAACVESLLAQDTGLEVLVADDGSTDRTAALVAERAAKDGARRLRLLAVTAPPRGWVGKNHALAFAARYAQGEWLLFTDADTVHSAGSLKRALEMAAPFDMFSLSPEQEMRTWWEKAVIPRVYRELEKLYRFEEINRPETKAAAANGQYILIRRAVYERLGGHAALAGEILEDVALARTVKQAGFRLFFGPGAGLAPVLGDWPGWPGPGLVRTRMYRNFRALWEGWTKNLFLLYGRRPARLLRAAGAVLALDLLPWALAPWFRALWLWILARHILYAYRLKRAGISPLAALYLVPGGAILAGLLVNSLAHYRRGRTILWKGREYATWSS